MISALECRGGAVLVALAALPLLLGGCADRAARGRDQLDALKQALPGTYRNAADAPAAAAVPQVSLSIAPAIAQAVGDNVFLVREAAAGNTRLVLSERIWTLEVDEQGRVLQHVYLLREPRRWIGASEHLDMLLSMLPEDLEPLPGCDLIWHRAASGFQSEQAPGACHADSSAHGQWIEQQAQLDGERLSLDERQFGEDGSLLSAPSAQYTLLLQRISGAGGAGSARATTPRPGVP